MSEAATLRAVTSELDPETLPQPVGYRMLVRPIRVESVTAGGIHLPDQTVEAREYMRYVAQVVGLGPACYDHPKFLAVRERPPGDWLRNLAYRFAVWLGVRQPSLSKQPWCRQGDWVLIRQYAGLEFQVRDRAGERVALRVVNDDEVLAVASTPEALVM